MNIFGLFLLSTDPGIANVRSGVAYSINGTALVGTASGGGGSGAAATMHMGL